MKHLKKFNEDLESDTKLKKELSIDYSRILNSIWNNKFDSLSDDYTNCLYDKKSSISDCFIKLLITLDRIKDIKYFGSNEEIFPKYKHRFDEHIDMYPDELKKLYKN